MLLLLKYAVSKQNLINKRCIMYNNEVEIYFYVHPYCLGNPGHICHWYVAVTSLKVSI